MSDFFEGNERLGIFEKLNSPMRKGSPEQLNVPDYHVLRKLISSEQWENAILYLQSFHAQNLGMINLLFDWSLVMPVFYLSLTNQESELRVRKDAITYYQKIMDPMIRNSSTAIEKNTLSFMSSFYTPEVLVAGENHADLTERLLHGLVNAFSSFENKIAEKKTAEALKAMEVYHMEALCRHDALINFLYAYPTAVIKESGEVIALKVSNESIKKNVLWQGMWQLAGVLTPHELSAFLAEHLRFHFSGLERKGQTTIIEDDKKIRLVFDPCGSGGALRRRLGDAIIPLKESHDLGWNKCGSVNLYCSHCALNEQRSVELYGYPKFVVEFQSDPNKPCGWTVYKNAEDVPAEAYERLGMRPAKV